MRSKKKKVIAVIVSVLIIALVGGTGAVVAATTYSAPEQSTTEPTASTSVEATETTPVVPTTEPDIKPYIIPDKLSGLKADKIGTDSVTLSWSKSKNATAYRVFRAYETAKGMSAYALYKTVSDTSFTDKTSSATRYSYKVEPKREILGIESFGDSSELRLMTKPEPVSALKSGKAKTKSVRISWNKSTRATSYIIYRADETSKSKLSSFKKIKTTTKTSFKNRGLTPGKLYQYKVTAFRASSGLSAESEPKQLSALARMTKPKKFTNDKTTLTSIKLKWQKVTGAEKYEVFRGKKKVATVSANSYTDKKLKHSTVYKYSVRAVRSVNGKNCYSWKSKMSASTNVKVPYVRGGLSGTWVQVSISAQTLTMYVNNKPYVTTPVVTGNAGALSTTKGFHRVISRKSPARLRGSYNGSRWDTVVNYWLGFTYSGQGIHDSTWRSAYGGHIYQGNGSHGCVNTPLSAVAKVYAKAYVGMPVIVY